MKPKLKSTKLSCANKIKTKNKQNMSFSSPSQPPKFYQPQSNFSSPNLYGNFKKSDLNIQFDKNPAIAFSPNPYSQRIPPNQTYGQINNEMYTSGTSRPVNGAQTGTRLNEMTSDLAKLKQQLSKIMTQAGTLQKRPMSTNQPNQIRTSQQLTSQPFTKPRFVAQTSVNSVNQIINKREQSFDISINGRSPPSYNRITESNKKISQQSPSKVPKLPPQGLSYGEKRVEKVQSESDKTFGVNVSKFQSFSTSHDLNNSSQQSQVSKNPEQGGNSYYFGKDYDIQPVLKVRDETPVKDVRTESSRNQLKRSTNDYQQVQQTPKSQQKTINIQTPANISTPTKIEPTYNLPQRPASFNSPPSLTKKSSSGFSHQIIVNRIVNEELTKKIEESLQMSQLKKKKQEDDYQYQEKIIQLEHEKRKLKHQINRVTLEKQNLQMAHQTQKAQKEALNKKYLELQESFKLVKFQLEDSKTRYKILERKLQSEASRPKVMTETLSFDEALKQQISEITKLKQQVEDKDEEIMRVKEINTSHRRQIESLHNQIKIEQLKAASQVNQCEQKHLIVIQDKENEIKTMKNLVVTLESKLDCAIKENKTKDAFMVQHLTGKAKTGEEREYIDNFFKCYEIDFPTNKIADKLREELAEIQRLKKTILEMAGSCM